MPVRARQLRHKHNAARNLHVDGGFAQSGKLCLAYDGQAAGRIEGAHMPLQRDDLLRKNFYFLPFAPIMLHSQRRRLDRRSLRVS